MEEIANSPRYKREPYTLLPLLKVSHVFINKTSITLRYSINYDTKRFLVSGGKNTKNETRYFVLDKKSIYKIVLLHVVVRFPFHDGHCAVKLLAEDETGEDVGEGHLR